jgi:NADH dehydrogenase
VASVFLTGASGFVGTRVRALLEHRGHEVHIVNRGAVPPAALRDAESYRHALEQCSVVLHLAALTGKAPRQDYWSVNVEGSRILLEAAQRAGVRRVILTSTIAVRFPEPRYWYAQSKAEAERLVKKSGMAFVVVRPTMVGGRGSPVLQGLARLADLPLIPVPGGGQVRVQPILVNDLAEMMVALVETEQFDGQVLEVGGREAVPLRELLERIRLRRRGRRAPLLPLPAGILRLGLDALERLSWRLPPLTVGQLATFRFDGTAVPNPFWEARRAGLAGLDAIVEQSVTA